MWPQMMGGLSCYLIFFPCNLAENMLVLRSVAHHRCSDFTNTSFRVSFRIPLLVAGRHAQTRTYITNTNTPRKQTVITNTKTSDTAPRKTEIQVDETMKLALFLKQSLDISKRKAKQLIARRLVSVQNERNTYMVCNPSLALQTYYVAGNLGNRFRIQRLFRTYS